MLNLIKVIIMLAIASFSLNVSAYAYKDKGSDRDYGVRYTQLADYKNWGHERSSYNWGHKRSSYKKWDTGSIDCGVLCKDDGYKSKVDKRHYKKKIYVALNKLKKKLKRKVAVYVDHHPHDNKPPHDNDVPEPGIVGLLAIGLLGMIVARRKLRV